MSFPGVIQSPYTAAMLNYEKIFYGVIDTFALLMFPNSFLPLNLMYFLALEEHVECVENCEEEMQEQLKQMLLLLYLPRELIWKTGISVNKGLENGFLL